MELKNLHSIYFLGIGGIGMSALARWFHQQGIPTSGYDKTQTPLTDKLVEEGIAVNFIDEATQIPTNFDLVNSLVVLTPAIPQDNVILNELKNRGANILKRSEVLGLITKSFETYAVAGTHGKTTTSTILAHLLKHAGKNVLAFLGGIAKNYDSNVIYNDPSKETIVVVEADEFDRSFLRLSPNHTIVTASDPDHLDIYKDEATFEQGFKDFVNLIPTTGLAVFNDKVGNSIADCARGKALRYGLGDAYIKPTNIRSVDGYQYFDYEGETIIKDLLLPLPGTHNILNTCAAITLALQAGVTGEAIKTALADFKGIKRRFEYIVKTDDKIYIDDYAHHPTEISACIKGVRDLFDKDKISIVFQPHLFSRTRDFMDGFADALSLADKIYLLDIYPARELPIEGIDADALFKKIENSNKIRCSKESLIANISDDDSRVFLTLGAGDIDQLVEPLKKHFEKTYA